MTRTMQIVFFCHTENGITEFDRTKEGLYTLRLSNEYKKAVAEKDNVPELEESLVTVGIIISGKM